MGRSVKFSVIIAAFNTEAYITKCITSLKNQTFQDFEALIIDDASTDSTHEVAKQAIGDDKRFSLLTFSENAGLSKARNLGLAHAKGDYVLFLDSDDYYDPKTLEILDTTITRTGAGQVFFCATTIYESHKLKVERYEDQHSRAKTDAVLPAQKMYVWMEQTKSFRPSACLYALKRSIILEDHLSFREGIIHEDVLFTLKAATLNHPCVFIPNELYIRRMRAGSTMTQKFSMKNVHGLFVSAQFLQAWIDEHAPELPEDFRAAFIARVFDTFNVAARYLFEIPESDVEAYRAKLTPRIKNEFDMHILELYRAQKKIYDEYENSRTYRLGRIFLAGPTWVKTHLTHR